MGTELDYATKRTTVGGFKFALCMENFEYPGYVTEKIVDVLSAGSIPLYWGAPDIGDFIPSDVFVDLRAFANVDDLVAHLVEMDGNRGMSMIQRGLDFLSSAAGDVYSFQHQGELIVDIATS